MYHSVKLYYPLLWLAIIILSATFASPEPGLRSKPEDEQEQFEEGDDIIGKHDKRSEESEPVELLDLEQPTSPKPKLLPEPRPGNETLYKTKCSHVADCISGGFDCVNGICDCTFYNGKQLKYHVSMGKCLAVKGHPCSHNMACYSLECIRISKDLGEQPVGICSKGGKTTHGGAGVLLGLVNFILI